jgi:dihydrofolate reductase
MDNIESIFAIDCNYGIAKNNNIPWKNKIDMNFFKSKTTNNIVIMGSKTLLSLPKEEPLKNRLNIIVTRNINKFINKYKEYNNILFFDEIMCKSFLENPEKYIETKIKFDYIYIIGGIQILNLFVNYCNTMWITKYKKDYKCDLFLNEDIIFSKYTEEIIYEDNELKICKIVKI